jgi:hypothetical protein
MMHLLQRHLLPVRAWFRHSLVLTYAFPTDSLESLLPPGLELDVFGDVGFIAVALVQTERLRPDFLPALLGHNFVLTGYRIFVRYRTKEGRTLRGLRILRSDTDRRLMAVAGNLLTHYQYRVAKVEWRETTARLDIQIRTHRAEADLDVTAFLEDSPAALPLKSPFRDQRQARLFAGPLPFTFDYEPQTHSIVLIEGAREAWHPNPVRVEVRRLTFLSDKRFGGAQPVLANAFLVNGVPYRWKRGVREALPPLQRENDVHAKVER